LLEKQRALKKETEFKDLLEEACDLAALYTWDYHPENATMTWSKKFIELFGISAKQGRFPIGKNINIVIPSCRKDVLRFIGEVQKANLSTRVTYKGRTTQKGIRTFYMEGKPMYRGKDQVNYIFGITQDVTQQKMIEEKLKDKNRELTKSNKELDKFVYSISHDINAPIASLSGLLNLMKYDIREKEINIYLEKIENSVLGLKRYITDVQDFSKNAQKVVSIKKIEFQQILDEGLGMIEFLRGSKKISLNFDIDDKIPFYSDVFRLKVILNNLLSNAIKYSDSLKEFSFINLYIKTSEKDCKIVIKDNGIGISNQYLERIFDMFFRASEGVSGSGIGLYIVKEMLSKLEGEISVQSELNIGTSFRLLIPNQRPSK
ncbi:PAS domain-containing sensor histidine kinase, partial [Xanthovirga aplysinae]|uniref:PAS domain-containing sensor histidine kinase n=1 Tax=Xanthovirga aplysinae TaxID=2529853 RepID=UPI0012BB7113